MYLELKKSTLSIENCSREFAFANGEFISNQMKKRCFCSWKSINTTIKTKKLYKCFVTS